MDHHAGTETRNCKDEGKMSARGRRHPTSVSQGDGRWSTRLAVGDIQQLLLLSGVPQVWRTATIIPLLKAGKPASELASYRLVSLTSCVVKVLERILADRLYHLAETNNRFSPLQAGFRKKCSCEEHITRIVQAIENGFQQTPMQRSVLVLLDYSKAYDMV